MVKPGLVSITFRKLNCQQIINLMSKTRLRGIEWGGDIHVPHGDTKTAEKVKTLTSDAGLEVTAYGSYYRAGQSEKDGLAFKKVLDSAEALNAPMIRVWAGKISSSQADQDYYNSVVDDSRRIAEMAKKRNIRIVFEFHDNTLNDRPETAKKLMADIDHSNLGTYWQPMHGAGMENNCLGIEQIIDLIEGVHVFHWWPDHTQRHLLEDGKEHWQAYLKKIAEKNRDMFCLMEFIKNDNPEIFIRDAETLTNWIDRLD